jgi:hypothetical protein
VNEAGLTRLAVAQLMEAGGPAAAFRPAQERPLQGYCLLTGAGTQCRIAVYLQQGAGHQVVLEGDLVWLQGQPDSEAPLAAGAPAEAVLAATPGLAVPTEAVGARVMADGAAPEESSHQEEHVPAEREVPRMCDPAEGPDFDVHRLSVPDPFCVPPAYPVPDPFAGTEPHVDLFKWIPQPAIEVIAKPAPEPVQAVPGTTPQSESPGAEAADSAPAAQADQAPAQAGLQPAGQLPATLSVPLTGRHPLAPRAGGTALINLREGKVQLTLRGLPSPAALGRDAATDRPYATYRAYLVNQRAGARHPLGLLTRAWGENFRLESEPDLPLVHFDTVLVTADDRTLPLAPNSAPQVLAGTYGQKLLVQRKPIT